MEAIPHKNHIEHGGGKTDELISIAEKPGTQQEPLTEVEIERKRLKHKQYEYFSSLQAEREIEYESGSSLADLAEADEYNNLSRKQFALFNKGIPSDEEVAEALAAVSFKAFHYRDGLRRQGTIDAERAIQGDLDAVRIPTIEKTQKTAEDLFMETCRQLYPDIKTPLTRTSYASIAQDVTRLVKNYDLVSLAPVVSIMEFQKENWAVAEKNSHLSLENLNLAITFAADEAEMVTQKNFTASLEGQDDKEIKQRRGMLAELNLVMYKMELMRDELQQKVYPRGSTSPYEEGQINAFNRRLNPEVSSEKPLSEIELKLNSLLDIEQKSESDPSKLYVRQIAPVVEAFRTVYPDENLLSRRLTELMDILEEKVKTINVKAILGKDVASTQNEVSYIRELAAERMLTDLSEQERQALAVSIDNEELRQRTITKGGANVPTLGRVLSQLLSRL